MLLSIRTKEPKGGTVHTRSYCNEMRHVYDTPRQGFKGFRFEPARAGQLEVELDSITTAFLQVDDRQPWRFSVVSSSPSSSLLCARSLHRTFCSLEALNSSNSRSKLVYLCVYCRRQSIHLSSEQIDLDSFRISKFLSVDFSSEFLQSWPLHHRLLRHQDLEAFPMIIFLRSLSLEMLQSER